MNLIHKTGEKGGYVVLWKKEGETPLQAMETFWASLAGGLDTDFSGESGGVGGGDISKCKRSYAGRLDPMAEGKLLVVYGDELVNKDKYIGLDKTYEIDVVLGLETDTGDVLGLVTAPVYDDVIGGDEEKIKNLLNTLVGKHSMPYPNFSSKTVGGVPMHELTKQGLMGDIEIPHKDIEIKDIRLINVNKINLVELVHMSIERVQKVEGDFRQEQILSAWKSLENNSENKINQLFVLKISVDCSSGAYMRWLCTEIGKLFDTKAFCNRIVRTEIRGV